MTINLREQATMPERYSIPGFSKHALIREDDGGWTVLGATGKPMVGHCILKDRQIFGLRPDDSGRTKGLQLGRIVLTALVGVRPDGFDSCHRDGDPTNNDPSNLYWGSKKENRQDSVRHGTHGYIKLTKEEVDTIRSSYVRGNNGKGDGNGPPPYSQQWLAEKYGVGQSQIGRILREESRSNGR